MKKIVSTVVAGALAATMFPVAPSFAGDRDWDDDDWKWKRHSWSRDRDWDDDWDDNRRWRHRHRDRDRDDFDGGAALIFGLAAGAIASGIASSGHYGGSYERCAATYRSFNPQTWTYKGYDGYYHRCPY